MNLIKTLFFGALVSASILKAKAQIPNPSFEQWQTRNLSIVQFEEPVNWLSNNITFAFTKPVYLPVKKTTEAHTGSYALLLQNVPDTNTQKQSAMIMSGTANYLTQEYVTKFKLNTKPTSLDLYYKYLPVNNDSFFIQISTFKNGDFVGDGTYSSKATQNTYAKISIPITYQDTNSIPDSANIIMYASSFMQVSEGTKLYIDDLSFSNAASKVEDISTVDLPKLYPNPTQSELYIEMDKIGAAKANIISLNGETMMQADISRSHNHIDLSGLSNGIYVVQLVSEAGISNQKISVIK